MTGKRKLADRHALVTGASRGLGAAIALRLAAEGARVVINYNKSAARAEAVVADIVALGGAAVAMKADVSRVSEVECLVADAADWLGGLDILVNNAGVGNGGVAFGGVDEAAFDRVFGANVKSVLFATQAAAPLMPDHEGVVINLGSLMTRQPGTRPLYSTSKAAVETLTVTLAQALASRGIRVNAVAPGPIDTDMMASNGLEGVRRFAERTALGRLGKPEEIAGVVAFLASEDASYITGETIAVGGGFR